MTKKNSQTEANKRWQEKNKEHAKYLSNRSRTRSFIKKQATLDDIQELLVLINEREAELTILSNKEQKAYRDFLQSYINDSDIHDLSLKSILNNFGIDFNEQDFPITNSENIVSFKTNAGNILKITYSKPLSNEFFIFLKEMNFQVYSK